MKFKKLGLIIGTFALSSSIAIAALAKEGGNGSGGGNVRPEDQVPMEELVSVIRNSRLPILGHLNYLEAIFRHTQNPKAAAECREISESDFHPANPFNPRTRSSLEKKPLPVFNSPPAYLARMFGKRNLRDLAASAKVEIRTKTPCLNSNGQEVDASIFSKREGYICVSAFNLQKKVNLTNYKAKIVGLVFHEITHSIFNGPVETSEPSELQNEFELSISDRKSVPLSSEEMVDHYKQYPDLYRAIESSKKLASELIQPTKDAPVYIYSLDIQMELADQATPYWHDPIIWRRYSTTMKLQAAAMKAAGLMSYICQNNLVRYPGHRCQREISNPNEIFKSASVVPVWYSLFANWGDDIPFRVKERRERASCENANRLPSYLRLQRITTRAQGTVALQEINELMAPAIAEEADMWMPFEFEVDP